MANSRAQGIRTHSLQPDGQVQSTPSTKGARMSREGEDHCAGTLRADGENMGHFRRWGAEDQTSMMKGPKTSAWHSKSKHLGDFPVCHYLHVCLPHHFIQKETRKTIWLTGNGGVRVNICTACYVPWKKRATSSELIFLLWSAYSDSALPIRET